MSDLFCGIDPGSRGGAGIINATSEFVHAWRWKSADPAHALRELARFQDRIAAAYLERVQLFPQLKVAFMVSMQNLLANAGIWQGFMISLGIEFGVILPHTWKGIVGLTNWRQRQHRTSRLLEGVAEGVRQAVLEMTPLGLAKRLWPQAPLKTDADDGMAVGLLLAECARRKVLYGEKEDSQLDLEVNQRGSRRAQTPKVGRSRVRQGVR
jgi:hypothetical protein